MLFQRHRFITEVCMPPDPNSHCLSENCVDPSRERKAKIVTILVTCIGYFMVILDTTVVNVALLKIQENFSGNVSELQWVIDGYALVFASFLLTAGTLVDRFGGKRIFLSGLMVFTAASMLCAIAPTLSVLIASRTVQGIGSALILPASLSLLSHAFPKPDERANAIGVWSAVMGIALTAGPVVGGFLVDILGWRSIFVVNLPVGIVGFFFTTRFISDSTRSKRGGIDLAGQVVGIGVLFLLTFALIKGTAWGWGSPLIIIMLVATAVGAVAFIAIERYVENPMLLLYLFSNTTFSGVTIVGFLLNFSYYGQLFLISLFFQQVKGYSPLGTGLAFLPLTVATAVAAFPAGQITRRFGLRFPLCIGLAICSAGTFAIALIDSKTSYTEIFSMLIAVGLGGGLASAVTVAAIIANAPLERSGIASAILNSSRQIGGVLGVALLGSFVSVGDSFTEGMHLALASAGGSLLIACIVTLIYI